MSELLSHWNQASAREATDALLTICGSRRWAAEMVKQRPVSSFEQLCQAADRIWATMREEDWMEAFACHPRIGEKKMDDAASASAAWSRQEQDSVNRAAQETLTAMATANAVYEERFGFTYIVCATGKSAEQMLSIVRQRLSNDRAAELIEAAEQQRQIMQIRLKKWMKS